MRFNEAPNYLQAADAHNIASDNGSVFDDVSEALGNAPSFLAVSIASGLNSFYNTGVAVGNIFSGEDNQTEERDTAEWISGYDDDLGKYYTENKTAADITGFVVSSFVPGLAGVKALRAGQTALRAAELGEVGSNLRLATNLLTPTMETYVKREAADLAAKSATFSFANANALKALGSGITQNVLEAVAFEGAVAATMFSSPVLADMDGWDLAKNIAMGGAFGGAFGAISSAAGTYSGVNRLLRAADARQSGVVASTRLTSSSRETFHSDSIVVNASDREALSQPITFEDVMAKKVAAGETGESITSDAVLAEVAKTNSLRLANIQKLENEARTSMRKLTNDDSLGNDVADVFGKLGVRDAQTTFQNMKSLSRLSETSSVQTQIKELISVGLAKTKNQALKLIDDQSFTNIRMHSGTIGEVRAGSMGVARIADKFTPTQIANKVAKTNPKAREQVDMRAVSSMEAAELRWLAVRQSTDAFYTKSVIGTHDLPWISKALNDGVESIMVGTGKDPLKAVTLQGRDQILKYYNQAQEEVVAAQKAAGRKTNHIEVTSNIRQDYLEGAAKSSDPTINYNAQESYAKEYSDFVGKNVSAADLHLKPRFVKATYDTSQVSDEAGHLLTGMQQIKYREKLAKEAINNVFAKFAGKDADLFTEITDAMLRKASRTEDGAGLVTNAGASYGRLDSMASYIGNLTANLTKRKITELEETFNPVAVKLLNSPDDAVRFSGISEIIAGTPEHYVLDELGTALIPKKVADYKRALLEGEEPQMYTLAKGSPEEIALDSETLQEAVKLHIGLNGKRNASWKEINAAQGNTDDKFLDTFRPIRPNPKDYRYVAFVKDETLVGVGHTKMLFANSSKELEDQISKVPKQYKVYTKGQSEEFYSAKGEWTYDKTLNENYIDHDLAARGISSRLFPQTDPQKIVNDWLQDHVAKENTLTKSMILAKYEKEVTELRRLGQQFTNVTGSRTGKDSLTDILTTGDKNPYNSMVKAMLNITKVEEHPWLTTANQSLDRVVSKAWNRATDIFQADKGKLTPQKVDEINQIFDELGFKSAYQDAATHVMANSSIPRGILSGFVRKANAFLTTTILRLDPFNALNNGLGNTVLMSSEMTGLMKAIREGSEEGAGELAKLSKINLPGVEGQLVNSPSKLIANAMTRLHGEGKDALIAEYKLRGLVPDLNDQYFKSLDAMSLHGSETVHDMAKKSEQISKMATDFANYGEKFTGNKFIEQFNRMIAADVMKQITEVAVKHGVLDEKAAWAYVNTFVNRTQGAVRAAERPLMFQGPIGQAIGLFQSYQFNMMQQMFRHVGEGNKKSVAMMLGMQGSVYGASSLPGFNLINSQLVGGASGNDTHQDIYSATNLVFGKTGADWLMFGAPSNVLRASLFTRGDTNPRTWSIVPNPTNPTEIPFISAFSKVFGSTYQTLTNVKDGAPIWNSFLNGIEHMGLSRPLAGMAQTARAFTNEDGLVTSTQANGTIVGSNDLASWATLTRLAGAKPIDEAITSNAYFRVQAYKAADREKRKALGTALKLNLQGGGTVDGEQVNEFAQKYWEKGGKQAGFNSWMMEQYKNTDKSQAEQLAAGLNSSYSIQMQRAMGGRDSLLSQDDIDSYQ